MCIRDRHSGVLHICCDGGFVVVVFGLSNLKDTANGKINIKNIYFLVNICGVFLRKKCEEMKPCFQGSRLFILLDCRNGA